MKSPRVLDLSSRWRLHHGPRSHIAVSCVYSSTLQPLQPSHLAQLFTTLRLCTEPKSHWPWCKVKVAPWAQRSLSHILCLLNNPLTPGGITKLLCTKYSPYWDSVCSIWVIDFGSRTRSCHCAVYGNLLPSEQYTHVWGERRFCIKVRYLVFHLLCCKTQSFTFWRDPCSCSLRQEK